MLASGIVSRNSLTAIASSTTRRSPEAAAERGDDAPQGPPPAALAERPAWARGSIVLVGMPGAGKSAIGRRLAVRLGLPFRDAYREVARELADGTFQPDRAALTATHLGGAGNLALDQARAELASARTWLTETHRALATCAERVWQP